LCFSLAFHDTSVLDVFGLCFAEPDSQCTATAKCRRNINSIDALRNTPENTSGFNIQTIPNYLIAAGDPPLPTAEVAAIHVLGGVPLAGPYPKIVIAKEQTFWPDVAGYYTSKTNKYLVCSGNLLRFNTMATYGLGHQSYRIQNGDPQSSEYVRARLSALVAMAHALGRILVLPRVGESLHFAVAAVLAPAFTADKEGFMVPAVSLMNADTIGVEWREASFFENPQTKDIDWSKSAVLQLNEVRKSVDTPDTLNSATRRSRCIQETQIGLIGPIFPS
jgi:hypothetical protein